MRIRLLLAVFITAALALIAWQRITINRLRAGAPAAGETALSGAAHSPFRAGRRIPAPPAAGTADPAAHLGHLRALADLTEPADQTLGATEWAASLQSAPALAAATAALSGLPEADPRRPELAARFGPALLAQWGKVAPADGLAAWDRLAEDLRLAMLPAPRTWWASTDSPLDWALERVPVRLLEAWLAHDAASFFSYLESRMAGIGEAAADPLCEAGLRLGIRHQPLEVLARLAAGPHAGLLDARHGALADALVAATGAPEDALARLGGVPDSALHREVAKELSNRAAAR